MERLKRIFRGFGRVIKAQKGYTLTEVAAVVAVTATLTAVALPVVIGKVDEGKVQRAVGDVQAIKSAVLSFLNDTGVPPFYSDTTIVAAVTGGSAIALPTEGGSDFEILSTDDGKKAEVATTITDWTLGTKEGSLDDQLIKNGPRYPTEGDSAWRGPYLHEIKRDPWGQKYYLTVKWFSEPTPTDATQKAVYVLSAGPNGIIETAFSQPIKDLDADSPATYTFTVGGDDIVVRII